MKLLNNEMKSEECYPTEVDSSTTAGNTYLRLRIVNLFT